MMLKKNIEDQIRDYLAENIERFSSLIQRYDERMREITTSVDNYLSLPHNQGGPMAPDLLREILRRRSLRGLVELRQLTSLGTEFVILSTGASGFQPRADILAVNTESSTLFLIEVKQGEATEREALTELAAYTQGLQRRLWGLSQHDVVWIPIATAWRTTVREAFAHQVIWNSTACIPLKAEVKMVDGNLTEVEKVELDLLDPPAITDEQAYSLFSWPCFTTFSISLPKNPTYVRNLVQVVVSVASRLNFSGFVLFSKSSVPDMVPFPYSIVISCFNPFRGALKQRQLAIVREKRGEIIMKKQVKSELWEFHDIDLRRYVDMNGVPDEEGQGQWQWDAADDAVSTRELALFSHDRINPIWEEFRPYIEQFVEEYYELGMPDLRGLLEGAWATYNTVETVSYFGLMQEAVMERLKYEWHHRSDGDDGPVVGDLNGSPLGLYSQPSFLFDFMSLMNFEHECQTDYDDNLE